MLQQIWSTVGHEHENISAIWPGSMVLTKHTVPAIVTPLYRNGNVLDYLGRHPNVDPLKIVSQAASALAYIHSKGVMHGNFCPVSLFLESVLHEAPNLNLAGKHLHHR
jgi:serine/threonine protein kinase